MPKKAAFKIAYDGEALRDHSMNVRDLAPALLSLGKLFDAANLALNGDKATVNLQVKAHSAGSFEVALELFQSWGAQVSHFLAGDPCNLSAKSQGIGYWRYCWHCWYFLSNKKIKRKNTR